MAEAIATVGDLAGICGHDGTNWLKVAVDANGYLKVIGGGVAGAIEVTQDTPGDLLTGIHGHVGGAWQKQPLQFGYSGAVGERVTDSSADAGDNTLQTTAVPAGEVHIVTTIHTVNVDTDVAYILISRVGNSTTYNMKRQASPGIGISVDMLGTIVLAPGDYIKASFGSCTAGDTIRLMTTGYKFDIDL